MVEESNSDKAIKDPDNEYRLVFRDFYNLMKFKVTKILLVSSLYDAFILEEEGFLTEQISGEYQDLELTSPPQVVRVPSGEEALQELEQGRYDLVITMTQIADLDPYEFGRKAKQIQKNVPVILLATDPGSAREETKGREEGVDKVFFWTGDSSLFLAITKYVEDKINIEPDTSKGIVKAILVIEDSPLDYSTFLPMFYTEIVEQTHAVISVGLNEQEKWLKKKTRPKILLAETFEEAKELYEKHRAHLLGVITDVTYPKGGKRERYAGFQLVEEVVDTDIPVLVQSSFLDNKKKADKLNIPFLHKYSDAMPQELRDFFQEKLCFGDFIFMDKKGKAIARAKDINDFMEVIQKVPLRSIHHHALNNDFSKWLMARGEIALARKLKPKKVSDFNDDEEMKEYLIKTILEYNQEKRVGIITDFFEENFEFEETFTRLGGGSLGGKGRGLAFLSSIFKRFNIKEKFKDLKIALPDTLVVGTDVFDAFMMHNDLYNFVSQDIKDEDLKRKFLKSKFPLDIKKSLGVFLSHVDEPIAVRSSSLLEDSQNQPFSGIYSTYMLPNNSPDEDERLEHLCWAIKLVYASTFMKRARAYIQSTLHLAEEKMAIVIQKIVGREYEGGRFYPVCSGVAQSRNFYPVGTLKREDGLVSVAFGLGKTVVEGGKTITFSPNHPDVIPGISTTEEMLRSTQNTYFALNMRNNRFDLSSGEESTLKALDIDTADKDGTLKYVASTYDANDDRLRDGVAGKGPKVLTFAGIRKYNMLPFIEVILELLRIGQRGMGRPVEIEFAGTVRPDGKPEFYALQIRPLVTLRERQAVVIEESKVKESVICTDNALGNGVIENISDVVIVSPDTFDSMKTLDISREIEQINEELKDKQYLLIGPGRWGTRDRFLGIPVNWDQISGARTIVEVSMEDFIIDPSYGTHFFHNVISLGIMYFTMPYPPGENFIKWDQINKGKLRIKKKYSRYVKLAYPLSVKVDGRSGRGIIYRSS